jgi:AraC-like DNA-binding protein
MIIKYLAFLSIFISGFFTLVLFLKKSPTKRANNILAISFLITTLCSLLLFYLFIAYQQHSYQMLRFFVPLDIPLLTAIGPCIYFYVQQVLGTNIRFRSFKQWIHFIWLLPSIVYVFYFMMLPADTRVMLLFENGKHESWEINTLTNIFLVQLSSYLLICYLLVNKQLKVSQFIIYNTSKIDISWLRTYFVLNLIIMLVSIPFCIFFDNDYTDTIIALLALVCQSIYIFIKSIWQTVPFKEFIVENTEMAFNVEKPKATTLLMTEDTAQDYITELTKIIRENKHYLQSDYTIQNLADDSNISVHHISNTINTLLQKSYTDFINEFRIEDAKLLLQDPKSQNYTIEKIAFDCGFGSKQNFNLVFKKIVKITPSEYRKSILS